MGDVSIQPPAAWAPCVDFDPVDVQREAAMFYGLFLRGHEPETLRRDIAIPRHTLERWLSHPHYDGEFRERARRVYHFRRQVLAVFDELVDRERLRAHLQ